MCALAAPDVTVYSKKWKLLFYDCRISDACRGEIGTGYGIVSKFS